LSNSRLVPDAKLDVKLAEIGQIWWP